MPLEDTLGRIDPQQVVDDLIRQRLPELAGQPVSGQDVVERLIRKVGAKPSQEVRSQAPMPRPPEAPQAQPTAQPAGFDASAYGTAEDETPQPKPDFDASEYGKPEEVPAPPAGGGLSDYPVELVKGAAEGAKGMLSSSLHGTAAATMPTAVPKEAGDLLGELRGVGGMDDAARAGLMKRATKLLGNANARDYNAAIQRIGAGGDPEKEIQGLAEMFGRQNQVVKDRGPVQGTALWKAGEAVEDFGKETLAPRPGFEGGWTRAIGGGLGSVATGIAVNMIPGIGPATAGTMFLTGGMGEAAERADKAKASQEDIRKAAMFGSIAGATDLVDVALPYFGSVGRMMGFFKRVGLAAVGGAITEGGQEGLQQLIQNAIAKGIYKPDQDIFEDVAKSAAVGAIVGGVVSGGFSAAGMGHGERPEPRAPETVDTDEFLRRAGATRPGAAPAGPAAPAPAEPPPVPPPGPGAAPGAAPVAGGAAAEPPAEPPPGGAAAAPEPPPAGPAPAAEPAEPGATPEPPRAEPAPVEPGAGKPPAERAVDRILQAYGYMSEDIDAMSPPQREAALKEALDAGVMDPGEVEPEKPAEGTREAPVEVRTAEDLTKATEVINQDHTPAQGEANNVQRGHLAWPPESKALSITLEAPKGGVRRGTAPDGTPFETTVGAAYGYIRKVPMGADGQHPDVFMGDNPEAPNVFVLDEKDKNTGRFRQTKSFVGFKSQGEAINAYLGTSSKARNQIGGVRAFPRDEFVRMAQEGKLSGPVVMKEKPRRQEPEEIAEENAIQAAEDAGIAKATAEEKLNKRATAAPAPATAATKGASAATPPVAKGFVRFYHGHGDTEEASPTSGGGRWVTTDPKYARNFRADAGPKSVSYVDIPKGDPTEVKARRWDEIDEKGGTNAVGTYRHIEVPESWAKKMRPFVPAAPAAAPQAEAKPKAPEKAAPPPAGPEPQAGTGKVTPPLPAETQAAIDRLPAVKEGYTRLYRGEYGGPPKKLADWLEQAREPGGAGFASKQAEGRWWTDKPELAEWYRNEADLEGHGRIVWQDVPSAVVRANRVEKLAEARKFSRDPANEFFLPTGYVGRGKALEPTRAEARAAVEEAIEETGGNADEVRQADIENAAELTIDEGIPADEALPPAVIKALVDDGHISEETVKEALGDETSAAILHPSGTSGDESAPAAASPAVGGEAPEAADERDTGRAADEQPVREGGEDEGGAAAETEAESAGGGETGRGAVDQTPGGERAAEPAQAEQGPAEDAVEEEEIDLEPSREDLHDALEEAKIPLDAVPPAVEDRAALILARSDGKMHPLDALEAAMIQIERENNWIPEQTLLDLGAPKEAIDAIGKLGPQGRGEGAPAKGGERAEGPVKGPEQAGGAAPRPGEGAGPKPEPRPEPVGEQSGERLDRLMKVYERHLRAEHAKGTYRWPISAMTKILNTFREGLAKGIQGVAIEGPAWKATFKELKIKPTKRALLEWLNPPQEKAKTPEKSDEVKAAEKEALDIAGQLLDLGVPGAKGFAEGILGAVKMGSVTPRSIEFYRKRLADFRAKQPGAKEKPNETDYTLERFIEPRHASVRDRLQTVGGGQELLQVLDAADEKIRGIVAEINSAGFTVNEIDSFTSQEQPELGALKRRIMEIAGGAVRLLNGVAYTKYDVGSTRVKEDLASLKKDVGFVEPKAPEKPKAIEGTSDKHPEWATAFEWESGGKVVYSHGDVALIEGFLWISGKPQYLGIKHHDPDHATGSAGMTRIDISAYSGVDFSPAEKAELVAVRNRLVAEDEAKHAANPDGPFKDGARFFASESISKPLAATAQRWLQMLGIKARVIITGTNDVAKIEGLHGPFGAIKSVVLQKGRLEGGVRRLPNGDYHVIITPSKGRQSLALEALAHEIGHILEKEELKNASPETQQAIEEAYKRWRSSMAMRGTSRPATTQREWVDSLRSHTSAKTTTGVRKGFADELPPYWSSFSEWFADQVARWSTSQERPLSLVDKFFARVVNGLRRLYASAAGKKWLPASEMKEWLDKRTEGFIVPEEAIKEVEAAQKDEFDTAFESALDEVFGKKEAPKPAKPPPDDRRGQPIIGTGTILRTKSGRLTSPAPKIDTSTDRKIEASIKRLDAWLLAEAREEVKGDNWQTTLLKGLNPNNFSQSDRDQVNLTLFGDPEGPRPSDVVKQSAAPRQSRPPDQRTTPEVAKSAGKKLVTSGDKAMAALVQMFGGGKKLGSGLGFDEETYAQAKPLFKEAATNFGEFVHDVGELVRRMVAEMQRVHNLTREGFEEMKPYLRRFVDDVKAGVIKLGETDEAGPRGEGKGPLDEVAPGEGSGTPPGGPPGGEPAGGGEPRPDGDRAPEGPGLPGPRGGGGGAPQPHPAPSGARGGSTRVGKGRAGGTRKGVSEEPAGGGVAPEAAPNLPAINYRITDETELGMGSEAVKFADNLEAIRTLKALERENRRATPEEQRALARYVGWGGLSNAFADTEGNWKEGWEKRGKALAELLTPEEMRTARSSTRNAHYTSRPVVDAIWAGVQRLGFRGGLSLELSAGTGNFIGLVPEEIAGRTRFIGIEFDSLTSRIARALYPQETILHTGLQHVPLPEGEALLNIGNPPFGSESLRFQYKPELQGLSIHNQFFLAGLDALAPDGIHAAVVSRYLLDAQSESARLKMAEKADLLGAIRLPDTAFKENARTEVVTDIVFMRRLTPMEEIERKKLIDAYRGPAEKSAEREKERQKLIEEGELILDWVKTTTVPDPLGGEPITVNTFFADNPHMIMGSLERSGTMRGWEDVTVRQDPDNDDLWTMLQEAVTNLPMDVQNADADVISKSIERQKSMAESLEIAISGKEAGHIEVSPDGKLIQITERETPTGGIESTKREVTPATPWSREIYQDAEGRYFTLEAKTNAEGKKVKSGRQNVYERRYFPNNVVPPTMRLGVARFQKLRELVGLRDLTTRQLTLEANDAPADEMEGNRVKLAEAYQNFVAQHGFINDQKNSSLLSDMPDGALVMALETSYRRGVSEATAKRTGEKFEPPKAEPAPIMSRRAVPKWEPVQSVETPAEALQVSLSDFGRIDMARIAGLLGKTEEEATAALQEGEKPLIYWDPESQTWETRDDYLSGQVAKKLNAARAAGLEANVRDLEAVQPERWGAENVQVMLGASWVPPTFYAQFADHLLGGSHEVQYSGLTNTFALSWDSKVKVTAKKLRQWSTDDAPFSWIYSRILNSLPIKIMKTIFEGDKERTVVDEQATAVAQLKAAEITNEFADWIFANSARRNQLVEVFNEKFNTRVTRQHDGSHLQLPGKVPDEVIRLRPHQKNAVWRGVHERFILMDHVVGAGKTFTAIARTMERRRMGLSRKPMVVVPNHLVAQWTADVYRLYPGARVLAAAANKFERSNRRKLFGKIATGDWDIIIVPHSSFEFVKISPDTELRFLEEEYRIAIEAVAEAWEQARAEGTDQGFRKPFNVKEAERLKTKIEGRLDKLKSAKRDNLLTFEQMGVDDLTVDEAHEFKNLFYSSRMSGVRGMGNKTGSGKAFDLYTKIRVLRDSPTGSVAFLTGTPISNSAVEMYTMMRYLAARELQELGLEHFDAWRAQSVSATSRFEPTESGGLKEVTRLGRSWSNMRALMELYYSFTDAVTQGDIDEMYAKDNPGKRFPVPLVNNGGRKEVVVKPTPAQSALLADIVDGFNSLSGIEDPKERNIERLKLMDRARKLSLDVRAADRTSTSLEQGGKLEVMADRIADTYKKWTKDLGTQLVFLDRGVPAAKTDAAEIKAYDELVRQREKALEDRDEEAFRRASDALEKYDENAMAEMKIAQRGGWNAYRQLKENLIARGIPADEIRFVQEANTDAEKQAMFDAVNDGRVRVLLGSTQRMGAGTNVQERIVALHHGDVTWKPSDIEQREGRIIRQGNKLLAKYGDEFKVDILAYVTERTIDAKMWDLNATKLKMLNGIRKYDNSFLMEFEDEDAVGMAEIAALASGDPMLMERVRLTSEIDKLQLLEQGHRRRKFGLEDQISEHEKALREYPGRIETVKAIATDLMAERRKLAEIVSKRRVTIEGQEYATEFAALQAAKAAAEQQQAGDEKAKYAVNINGQRLTNKDDIQKAITWSFGSAANPFEVTIDGKPVITRSQAAETILAKAIELGDKGSATIGQMLGGDLDVETSPGFKGSKVLSLYLTRNGKTVASGQFESERGDKAKLTHQSVISALTKLDKDIEQTSESTGAWMQRAIDVATTELPSLREDVLKPFKEADKLAEKRQRLAQVTSELAARTEMAESAAKSRAVPREEEEEEGERAGMAAPRLTPQAAQHGTAIENMVRTIVERVAGTQIKVEFRGSMRGGVTGWAGTDDRLAGSYTSIINLIEVAMDLGNVTDKAITAFHESWHAVEDHFVNDQEMAVMVREEPRLRRIAAAERRDLSAEQISKIADFEVRATAFQAYARERMNGGTGVGLHIAIRRAFERILQALRQISNGLRGIGFQTTEDIFQRTIEGEMRQRPSRVAEKGSRMSESVGREAAREKGEADVFNRNVGREQSFGPVRMEPYFDKYDLREGALSMEPTEAGMAMRPGPTPAPGSGANFGLPTDRFTAPWRSNRPLPERLRGVASGFVRASMDRMVDVLNLQRAIESSIGERLLPGTNPYIAETLMYGRVGERAQDIWTQQVEPILEDLRQSNVPREQLNEYLYARHAEERNEAIGAMYAPGDQFFEATYDPDIVGGSGMSTNEANAIIARYAADPDRFDVLRRNAARIDDIIRDTRDWMVRDGLISEEQAAAWESQYASYVPLRGFAEGYGFGEGAHIKGGPGMSVPGPETKDALGRKSRADDIMAHVVLQAIDAAQRGERNRVAGHFNRLAQNFPHPDLWTTQRVKPARRYNPLTGLVEEYFLPVSQYGDDVVVHKAGGQYNLVTVHHPGVAGAMKNIGIDEASAIERNFLRPITRFFAAVRTRYNPAFVIKNFVRDQFDAAVSVAALGRGPEAVAHYMSVLPKALRGVFNAVMRGRTAARWEALHDEFRHTGGKVTWFKSTHEIDELKDRIERDMNAGRIRRALSSIPRFIERLNEVTETATRLAVYETAQHYGLSRMEAASVAREATLNFDRKGALTSLLRSLYPFFNPSIQANLKFSRMLRGVMIGRAGVRAVRRFAVGMVVGGFLAALFNRFWGGDDDDDKAFWDKIPDHEKQSNIILMTGRKGDRIKIPMFAEGMIPWRFGAAVADQTFGKQKWGKSVSQVLNTVLGALPPPFSGTAGVIVGEKPESGGHIGQPTSTDWLVSLYTNTDWKGAPIHPEPFPTSPAAHLPKSETMFSWTDPRWQAIARGISQIGGGDRYHKPALPMLDLHPEDVKFLTNQALGGVWAFTTGSAQIMEKIASGVPLSETDIREYPILKDYFGTGTDVWTSKEFRELRRKTLEAHAGASAAAKAGLRGTPEYEELSREAGGAYIGPRGGQRSHGADALARAQKVLKRLGDEADLVRADSTMSAADKQIRMNAINESRNNLRKQVLQEAREREEGGKMTPWRPPKPPPGVYDRHNVYRPPGASP